MRPVQSCALRRATDGNRCAPAGGHSRNAPWLHVSSGSPRRPAARPHVSRLLAARPSVPGAVQGGSSGRLPAAGALDPSRDDGP